MSDFYAETRAIIESKADKLSTFTYNTYLSHLHKLQLYRPMASCKDVSESFIIGYIDFMRTRRNSEATIYRSLSILRMFVKQLLRRRKIQRDPMQNISLKRGRSRREFLELNELENLYRNFRTQSAQLNFGEREALRAFLFSCFTGLRYSDLRNLTPRDMQNGKIRIFTQKTDAQIYIPVPDQALELVRDADTHFPASDSSNRNVREHANNPRCAPSQPANQPPCQPFCQMTDRTDTVLHVVNNSTFNKNLRAGAKKLGFRRYLHAHLARHTFATSCITFGMPIEIISKMLGHTSIQTTLIYANYSNSVIDREMRKFKINVPK